MTITIKYETPTDFKTEKLYIKSLEYNKNYKYIKLICEDADRYIVLEDINNEELYKKIFNLLSDVYAGVAENKCIDLTVNSSIMDICTEYQLLEKNILLLEEK